MAKSHDARKATPRVGDEAQIITINIPAGGGSVIALHAHLAAHFSCYFGSALGVPILEARTLSLTLDEPSIDYTMPCFVAWVYAAASEKCTMGGGGAPSL